VLLNGQDQLRSLFGGIRGFPQPMSTVTRCVMQFGYNRLQTGCSWPVQFDGPDSPLIHIHLHLHFRLWHKFMTIAEKDIC